MTSPVSAACSAAGSDPARRHDPCVPAWGTPTRRQRHRFDPEAAADDQPGDERVRVPHLACVQLVAAPDECRHLGHEVKHAPRHLGVICQPPWALHSLADIRDLAIAPAADLVAEEPHGSRPAASDRPFGNNAAHLAVVIADWCHLDHVAPIRHMHRQRRVVEVAARTPLVPRYDCLEDAAVQPHGMPTGT